MRAFRYFWCNFRACQIGKRVDADIVFSNSTPPTQGALCAIVTKKIAKRCKKKVSFIYNLQDIFIYFGNFVVVVNLAFSQYLCFTILCMFVNTK